MSTSYYLVCESHKQSVDAANWAVSGMNGPESSHALACFVVLHRNCSLRVLNEHLYNQVSTDYEEPFEDFHNLPCDPSIHSQQGEEFHYQLQKLQGYVGDRESGRVF